MKSSELVERQYEKKKKKKRKRNDEAYRYDDERLVKGKEKKKRVFSYFLIRKICGKGEVNYETK